MNRKDDWITIILQQEHGIHQEVPRQGLHEVLGDQAIPQSEEAGAALLGRHVAPVSLQRDLVLNVLRSECHVEAGGILTKLVLCECAIRTRHPTRLPIPELAATWQSGRHPAVLHGEPHAISLVSRASMHGVSHRILQPIPHRRHLRRPVFAVGSHDPLGHLHRDAIFLDEPCGALPEPTSQHSRLTILLALKCVVFLVDGVAQHHATKNAIGVLSCCHQG